MFGGNDHEPSGLRRLLHVTALQRFRSSRFDRFRHGLRRGRIGVTLRRVVTGFSYGGLTRFYGSRLARCFGKGFGDGVVIAVARVTERIVGSVLARTRLVALRLVRVAIALAFFATALR